MATTGEKPQVTVSIPEGAETIHDTSDEDRFRLLLNVSSEWNRAVEELALRNRINKGDVINMAVGILKFLSDQVRQGKKVGVAAPGQELETAITNI